MKGEQSSRWSNRGFSNCYPQVKTLMRHLVGSVLFQQVTPQAWHICFLTSYQYFQRHPPAGSVAVINRWLTKKQAARIKIQEHPVQTEPTGPNDGSEKGPSHPSHS